LNETILWLLYVVGAGAAFAAVYWLGWKIVPSTLGGTAIATLGWALLYFSTEDDKRPPFWKLDLSMNVSFAMIFAALGAALGYLIVSRNAVRRESPRD
jgi:hypothetical protein